MSDCVQPYRGQPTRLPCPWDSPGKNTGVGCHFLLQCMKVKSLSRVRLFMTPWTAAYQAPPSMGFSRQEYWSGVPLPSPPDVQAGFRKGRGIRDQIANICWIIEKAREFQKNIYFCFIDYTKAFDCVDHNSGKFFKRWEYQNTLPAS